MSYAKTIGGYRVTFDNEMSYLNCRLQYLQETDPCEKHFPEFIQGEMYDNEKCVVENIVSLIDCSIPLESSFAVGNDNYYNSQGATGSLVIPGGDTFYRYYCGY